MPETSQDNWTPCERGEVSGMVDRLQRIRRRVLLQRAVTATVCVLGLITVGTVYWGQDESVTPLSHREALRLLSEYHVGRLDADTTARMKAHLARCESCRVRLRELNGEEVHRIDETSCRVAARESVSADGLLAAAAR
jgi:hypothetical protein